MASAPPAPTSPAPPTYAAAPLYWGVLAAVVAVGAAGSAYMASAQPKAFVLLGAMTALYLLLLALTASMRVSVDGDGITQRWLYSRAFVPWKQVARMDRTQSLWMKPGRYTLHDAQGKELMTLFLLPLAAQEAIAQEVLSRTRLRPAKAAPAPPLLARWEKK